MSRNFFWGLIAFSIGTGSVVYGIVQPERTFALLGSALVLMGAFLISADITEKKKNRD